MENVVALALFATLGTWGLTALGAATVFCFRNPAPKTLNLMLGFASGVMIAASFWSLCSLLLNAPKLRLPSPLGLWSPLDFCRGQSLYGFRIKS